MTIYHNWDEDYEEQESQRYVDEVYDDCTELSQHAWSSLPQNPEFDDNISLKTLTNAYKNVYYHEVHPVVCQSVIHKLELSNRAYTIDAFYDLTQRLSKFYRDGKRVWYKLP